MSVQVQKPEERLAAVAQSLRNGEQSPNLTVRSFLSWFYSERRGRWIVQWIRTSLANAGLKTEPDFESTYIDGLIQFVPVEQAPRTSETVVEREVVERVTVEDHAEVRVTATAFADPTYRISKLAAANRVPVSVRPDASLTEVVTVMMANDFSQLPVTTNERDVKGVISWRSIGSRLALGQVPAAAREAMEPHAEVNSDASLFTAIPLIVEQGYVLVRSNDQRIVGIITTSDLSLQFQQMTEPFLLLGEIENHIRRIISGRFRPEELAAARDPDDSERQIESAADLTFGEYKRLLEEPERWSQLNLKIDRVLFVKMLDKVRDVRNDVMHFDPDGIPESDLYVLRDFARFLRNLQYVGAT